MDWMTFITIAVLAFALIMVLAGIFTAYFGTGKSRTVGFVLALIGLSVGVVWVYLTGFSDIAPFCDGYTWDAVREAIINLVGILVGALVAVGIFLYAVMKS